MNKKQSTVPPYMKVIATKGSDTAELFLYGVIGQDFWWDESLKEESLTDLAVVRKIKELEAEYSRINIRINSPGGSVYHGDAIIAAIRNSPAEIHAYNDGWASSMAADIWLSSPNRHMATNAKLMIHATSTIEYGNAKQLRKAADMLEKMDEAAIASMAESTSKDADEIREMFYADYEDHYLTRSDAMELGLITDTEEYKSENTPADMEKMSFQEVMRHFQKQGEKEEVGFFEKMKNKWLQWQKESSPSPATIPNKKSEPIMNSAELTRSLTDGDITHEEVANILREAEYQVEAPKKETTETQPADIAGLLKSTMQEVLKPLQDRMDALEKNVEKVGDQPGDKPAAAPAAPNQGDDAFKAATGNDDMNAKFEKMNADMAAAFKKGERISISPATVSTLK